MFLVIRERSYSTLEDKNFQIEMYTREYNLALDFARCLRKEAEEKQEENLTFAVVKYPDTADHFIGETEKDLRTNDIN